MTQQLTSRRTTLSLEHLERRDLPATLGSVATALAAQIRTDAQVLVRDVATLESARPTIAINALTRDLVALSNDDLRGSIDAVFSDTTRLLGDLRTEAVLISAYHLPQSSALNNIAVQRDFIRVAADKQAVVQLVNYVHQHPNQPAPTANSNLLSVATSIGGISSSVQSILNQEYQNALNTYHPGQGNSNSYLSAQEGILDSGQHFSDIVNSTDFGGGS